MEIYSCNLAFAFLITIASISAISLCSYGNHVEVACKESERQALLKFKQDLIDLMNRLSTWDIGDQSGCCSWTGVGCDNLSGHVRELHLGFPYQNHEDSDENLSDLKYKLGGTINPSLLNLKYLNHLDLSNNDFQGIQIPSFIGSIKSLVYLNLSHAEFGGVVPYQLGNLSGLRYLDLTCSDLKVEHLEMSFVDLSKAFESIKVINMLHSLQSLRLSECELHNSAPLSIVNSTSLVTLDLVSYPAT